MNYFPTCKRYTADEMLLASHYAIVFTLAIDPMLYSLKALLRSTSDALCSVHGVNSSPFLLCSYSRFHTDTFLSVLNLMEQTPQWMLLWTPKIKLLPVPGHQITMTIYYNMNILFSYLQSIMSTSLWNTILLAKLSNVNFDLCLDDWPFGITKCSNLRCVCNANDNIKLLIGESSSTFRCFIIFS